MMALPDGSKYWQSSQFKKLQKLWYRKLEADGFNELENLGADGEFLAYLSKNTSQLLSGEKSYFSSGMPRTSEQPGAAEVDAELENGATLTDHPTFQYYYLASQFSGPFKNDLYRRTWELHAEGESIRAIVTTLKLEGLVTSRTTVHLILNRLKPLFLASIGKK